MNKKKIIIKAVFLVIISYFVFFTNLKQDKISNLKNYNIIHETYNKGEPITYNGILEVIERKLNNKVIVKLNNNIESEFVIYSSKLKVGNQLKISYSINNNDINIKGIEHYNITNENKQEIIDIIPTDLKEIIPQIEVYNNINMSECINIKILPIRIEKINYLTMSSIDYILTLSALYDGINYGWQLDDKPVIYIKGNFKVLNFNNIPYLNGYDNQNTKNVKYYIEDNKIYFEHNDNGIYDLEIQFSNGNIIKTLFL